MALFEPLSSVVCLPDSTGCDTCQRLQDSAVRVKAPRAAREQKPCSVPVNNDDDRTQRRLGSLTKKYNFKAASQSKHRSSGRNQLHL